MKSLEEYIKESYQINEGYVKLSKSIKNYKDLGKIIGYSCYYSKGNEKRAGISYDNYQESLFNFIENIADNELKAIKDNNSLQEIFDNKSLIIRIYPIKFEQITIDKFNLIDQKYLAIQMWYAYKDITTDDNYNLRKCEIDIDSTLDYLESYTISNIKKEFDELLKESNTRTFVLNPENAVNLVNSIKMPESKSEWCIYATDDVTSFMKGYVNLVNKE